MGKGEEQVEGIRRSCPGASSMEISHGARSACRRGSLNVTLLRGRNL